VTLDEIARLVRAGEDVKVIDNETEDDLTAITFAQIILEEEKRKTNLISVPFLRRLIRTGEARMQDFSDRATRGIEALGGFTEKAGERVREVVEGSGKALGDSLSAIDDLFGIPQKRMDVLRESARKSVDKLRANPVVRRELERIAGSLHTIEEAIQRLSEDDSAEAETSASEQNDPPLNGEATPAGTIESKDVDVDAPYPRQSEAVEKRHVRPAEPADETDAPPSAAASGPGGSKPGTA
jgi:polyhydroxyalkanoate synthesis regulator protein